MIALGRSHNTKCREVRQLKTSLNRRNGEEEVAGHYGIILREYEARSLPALKARLETAEREKAKMEERLKRLTNTLQGVKQGCIGLTHRLEADKKTQDCSRNSPSLPSPLLTAVSPRKMNNGKEKEFTPVELTREPVNAFVQRGESSITRLSHAARNGDMRRRPIQIRKQSLAHSEAGIIGVIEESFEEGNTPYSPINALGISCNQRDPSYFIGEAKSDGGRSPVIPPPRPLTPHPASPEGASPGKFSVVQDVDYRRSYAGPGHRQANTVTSPGARSLPATSPGAGGAQFDEVSLDD